MVLTPVFVVFDVLTFPLYGWLIVPFLATPRCP